jgi:hypothetical protein
MEGGTHTHTASVTLLRYDALMSYLMEKEEVLMCVCMCVCVCECVYV